jgi:hypothetical protein
MTARDVDYENLDCRLFVDGVRDCDLLAEFIAAAMEGEVSGSSVASEGVELIVGTSDEEDPHRSSEFPGGFLYFRCNAEVYFAPDVSPDSRVALVGHILERLWDLGHPAVAACDYEDRLPHGGGNRDRQVPWPGPT